MEEKDDTIYLSSKVNEIYATTELTQYFTNTLEEAIELTILFPIKDEISLSKFVVAIGDKIVLSKVMSKEKAEEKYNDVIASGNVGVISKYEEESKAYSVNIGNLKPKEKIKLNSIFLQMIGAQDLSYEFSIMEKYPSFYYKDSKSNNKPKNKIINAEFEIKTQSKITRLIAPFMDKEAKKYSTYEIKYSPDYKTAEIKYIKYPNEEPNNINNNDDDEDDDDDGDKDDKPASYSSFCILFRTENMNKPLLCTQYNPEFKETAYSLNYVYTSKNLKEIPIPEKPDEDNSISYAEKYEENNVNETPGLFIFLIDQSGSMSGKSIELVKESLVLFMQSLPDKSYFQLIGFGSDYKKYNEEPVIYNKENVEKIINIINGLSADLGGTNISGPLKSIYDDECYSKINLSRNIFLLTDGQVFDREKCINLITANSGKFRIHSLGIGNDFDKVLIQQCGKLGKGSSSFVKEVEKINSVVIDALNKSLRPYITDIKFEFENYKEEIASNIITCNPINNFTYQNEIMNYSFILPGNKELSDLKIKIICKDPINIIEKEVNLDNMMKIENGEEMSKMIIGKALKNNDELIKDEEKEIKFAKKYQILSKNTALFAEIINEESQQSKLLKVELNKFESRNEDRYYYNSKKNKAHNLILNYSSSRSIDNDFGISYCKAAPSKLCCKLSAAPKKSYKKMKNSGNFLDGIKSKFKGIFSSKNSVESKPVYSNKPQYKKNYDLDLCDLGAEPDYINCNNNYENIIMKEPLDSSKNINDKDFNKRLIRSQDIIGGFWNENDDTKKIIDIITVDKFDKIKNKINVLNKGANEIKIIYTILVVYYLNTKCIDKLNEYKLVINKAIKFLQKNGINYDDIISDI